MTVSDKALAQAFREFHEKSEILQAHFILDRARELDATYQPNINSGEVDNGGDAKGGDGVAEIRWVIGDRVYGRPTADDALTYAANHKYPATPPAQAAEAVIDRVVSDALTRTDGTGIMRVTYVNPDDARSAAAQAGDDCTCPSGDGSLRWPCPQHPPVQQKASAASGLSFLPDPFNEPSEDDFFDWPEYQRELAWCSGWNACLAAAIKLATATPPKKDGRCLFPDCVKDGAACVENATCTTTLIDSVETVGRHADRYRWLRENLNVTVSHWFCTGGGQELDNAIDAAIAAMQEESK